MAIKKSSKSVLKRQRQTKTRTARNRGVRNELKTLVKAVNADLASGNTEAAKKSMQLLCSRLDKAVKKGVIHRNNAANKKSAVMKKYHVLASGKKTENK